MKERLRLKELEQVSRLLEPGAQSRSQSRAEVIRYAEAFLETVSSLPAFRNEKTQDDLLRTLLPSQDPVPLQKLVGILDKEVDAPGLNPASGGHLGYIPGGGIYLSALGDYLADVFNRYAGIFYAGPGAVRMENMLIRWMASVCGLPENTAGNLTSGGSLANLMAIVTARDAKNIRSTDIPDSVIYLTTHAHHSVQKAIRIAGLSEARLCYVEMDEQYRMRPEHLTACIRRDLGEGLKPFLLIASAGTTDTGAVDPLDTLGEISRDFGLWYHIDAAYGGFFILTDEGKKKLKGMDSCDSLTIDPHKGLFLPYGLGVVLVKDKKHLNASHHYSANYMQDAKQANDESSPADLSPELTKHFRGLRLWLPLLAHGLQPFIACLEEKLLLTQYFYREIKNLGFETGPAPELSVATYRFIPKNGDPDLFNLALQEQVVRDGSVFISSTRLQGKVWLRLACLSFRTHLETIDRLLKVLKKETAGK